MLDPNRARSQGSTGKIGSEFTSGQLVIAICMILVLALICFSLGVLVGKYEKNSGLALQQARTPERNVSMPPAPRNLEQTAPQEGVQTSPRPLPAQPQQKPAAPGFPASQPKVAEIPAPAPASASGTSPAPAAPMQTAQAQPQATAAQPQPPAPPAAPTVPAAPVQQGQPAAAPPAQAPPAAGAPAQPGAQPAPSAPAQAPQPEGVIASPAASPAAPGQPAVVEATPAAAGKPGSGQKASAAAKGQIDGGKGGAYGIQVASCTGPKRKQNAEEFKKRLQTNAGLQADLIPSSDGQRISILVGNYPDKESAKKACAELKKRAGFAECFVKHR